MSLLTHLPAVDLGAGSLAVVYRTASYVWGRYTATYPDDHDTENLELEDNREYGYVAKLTDAEPERFGRTFTRADVHADAVLQVSDVERKIDEAAVVTDGDTVVRREIGEDGLNGLVPYVDFNIGDIIPCRSWGKLLYLPVISITVQSSPGGVLEYRVMVGSRLVSDRAELEQVTAEIDQRVAKDKEELRKRIERERAQRIRADKRETRLREHALSEAHARAEQAERRAVEEAGAAKEHARGLVDAESAARSSAVESVRREAAEDLAAESSALQSALELEKRARESGLSAEQQAREEALRVTREQWQEKLRLERIAREEGITAEQVARREALEAEQAARREGFKAAERAREFIKNEVNQQRTSADDRFKELRAFLTGAGKDQSDLVTALEGLNQQLRRNGAEPAPGLIPAYMQLNTELWEMQTKLNEALQQADEALKKGQEANTTAIELNRRVGEQNARISRVNREMSENNAEVAQTNRELIQVQQAIAEMNRARIDQIKHDNAQRDKLFTQLQQQERATKAQRMRVFSLGSGSDSHWSYSSSNGRLVAKGSWRGDVQAVTTVNRQDSRGNRHNMLEAWEDQVPKRGGSRTYQVEVADGNGLIWYHVQPGQSRVISMDRSNFTPNYASWHQVDAFNVQSTGTHNFQARVVWDAVHRGANYQLRVSVDNRVVISDSSGTSWGPMWPWENGVRSQEAPLTSLDLRAGQRVKFEVYSDAQKSSSRVIQSAVCKAHWIDD
ncbi:hypothetical protein QPX10_10365 [Corynebacterium pseudodiphtheriticum]|uniref:hypothetical protein n=1 Tax=Corynebacterium TaxID=1716 RepID=UPI00253F79D0|nr:MULTISPECIES: hypothetical protein [Corynebacterium]MDK4244068.1 hypothetical protein [Corynebacterium pseudodiphtheriticum]MDK4258443.1 hypothetical protein [Corynebacterium propinquum]